MTNDTQYVEMINPKDSSSRVIGTISPSSGIKTIGEWYTLTLTENYPEEWAFSKWVCSASNVTLMSASSNPGYFKVTATSTTYPMIECEMKDVTVYHTITLTQPSEGTLTASPNPVKDGSSATITYTSSSGYRVKTWSISGGGSWITDTNTATCSSVTSAVSVSVTLEADTYTVTLDPSGGSVSPDTITVTYGGTYGDLPTPTYSGKVFQGWYSNNSATSEDYRVYSSTVVTKKQNHTLTAVWVNTYSCGLQYNANGATSGSVPDSQYYYPSVTAIVSDNTGNLQKTGYIFSGWNTLPSGSGTDYAVGSSYSLTETGTKTLYAKWVAGTGYTLTTSSSPSAGGSTSGGGTYSYDDTVTITATANSGYSWESWDLTNCELVGSSGASETVKIKGNATAVANFTTTPTTKYDITITPIGNGSISGASSGEYATNETLTMTAVPNSGYKYKTGSWKVTPDTAGVLVSIGVQATYRVGTEDATLSCEFEEDTPTPTEGYTISSSVYGGGAISIVPTTVTAGSTCSVTATPSSINSQLDYLELISGTGTWSGTTLTPTSNCVVRAVFKRTSKETPTTTDVQSKKYKMLIHNPYENTLVLLCMNNVNGLWYDDLTFGKKLNEVGTGSFKLYAKSSADCVGDGEKIEVGCRILILQDNYPVYYGYITEYNKDDINYYGDHTYSGVNEYTVSFSDVLRELNYSNPSGNGTYTGNIKTILYKILNGLHLGHISSSQSNTSISISAQNTLSQLDKLGDTVGWRYRSRPEVTNIVPKTNISSCPVSGTTGTITVSSNLANTSGIIIVSNGDSCHAYRTTTTNGTSFPVTDGVHTDTTALGTTAKLYFVHDYVVDFAPSFLQTNSIVVEDDTIPSTVGTKKAWGTNNKAKNVKSVEGVDVKYGTVSVTSSQDNGLSYTVSIPLTQEHNNDYSFENSTYVSESMDFYCSDWTWDSSANTLYFDVNGTALLRSPYSTDLYVVFKKKSVDKFAYVKYGELGLTGFNVQSTTTDLGIPITHIQFTITSGSSLHEWLDDEDAEPYAVTSNYYTLQDSSLNGVTTFRIGGEGCTGTISSGVAHITNRLSETDIINEYPMHSIGSLVMDASSVASESPFSKYTTRTLYAQPQSGLSYMDVDLLASSFAVFGSNFDAQGSASVSLPFFVKDDSTVDMIYGLPEVGDHIAFYDSSKNTSDAISDYELLSYSIDVKQLTNTIKYGTYSPSIGSAIYNLRKNITTNIVRG